MNVGAMFTYWATHKYLLLYNCPGEGLRERLHIYLTGESNKMGVWNKKYGPNRIL